ncbi:uncharacterized protein L201_001697 [Kwoniella dendrophila CBS 6074]|uniref:Myb-like domain-containing protein n=1 Tax=Kwoniella dendrophila CBS 6074 TaxID=1295534 RepID=A0AAX4JQR0_9TREE
MPADRTKSKAKTTPPITSNSTSSEDGGSATNSTPTKKGPGGWSSAEKSLLFEHIVKFGENDFERAVPGKTSKQAREQWKKTLLPQIRKQCGFFG